jgi:hypothetical protein
MLINFLERESVKLNFESWQKQKNPPTQILTAKS